MTKLWIHEKINFTPRSHENFEIFTVEVVGILNKLTSKSPLRRAQNFSMSRDLTSTCSACCRTRARPGDRAKASAKAWSSRPVCLHTGSLNKRKKFSFKIILQSLVTKSDAQKINHVNINCRFNFISQFLLSCNINWVRKSWNDLKIGFQWKYLWHRRSRVFFVKVWEYFFFHQTLNLH